MTTFSTPRPRRWIAGSALLPLFVSLSVATASPATASGSIAGPTLGQSALPAATADSDVHVGSFNISGMNSDGNGSGEHQVWAKRMPVAVSQILGEQSDVVGLQEAYWGTSNPQYLQLRDALNAKGGTYEVVDTEPGTSAGDRILYNTATLKVLDHGAQAYTAQAPGKQARYFSWATFKDLSSGKNFFFSDTHLDPYSKSDTSSSTVKVKEWRELIALIPKLNTAKLPVVTVGDFNTSKWWKEAKTLLPAMKSAGFGDVMSQQYQKNPPTGVRAEKVENGWINSFNGYRRDVTKYSYSTNHSKVGNGIDWVFATNSLRVKKWKVVIDFDAKTLKVTGVIPSDHNMLAAVIVL